jgi:hypothetical protein
MENVKGRGYLEDLNIDRRTILKQTLKKQCVCVYGMDLSGPG